LFHAELSTKVPKLKPSRRLVKGYSDPEDSTIVGSYSSPITAMFHALRCEHFAAAQVPFIAVLCEVLTVSLANVLLCSGSSFAATNTCMVLSISIISLMLATLALISFARSRLLLRCVSCKCDKQIPINAIPDHVCRCPTLDVDSKYSPYPSSICSLLCHQL